MRPFLSLVMCGDADDAALEYASSRMELVVAADFASGVKAANAPVVGFLKAGDVPAEPEILALVLQQMAKENADIIHFGLNGKDGKSIQALAPWADRLQGETIFAHAVRNRPELRGKFYRRDFCISNMQGVRFPRVDSEIFLGLLFSFHAERYVGCDLSGGVIEDKEQGCVRRILSLSMLINDFIPSIAAQGCALETAKRSTSLFQDELAQEVGVFLDKTGPEDFFQLQEQGDEVTALRAILTGHPIMQSLRKAQKDEERRVQKWRRRARKFGWALEAFRAVRGGGAR